MSSSESAGGQSSPVDILTTTIRLRAWQQEALTAYFDRDARDFLVSATPGAGKTTFALRLASELLQRRLIDRVTVVAPTEHLKLQWADAAHRAGIRLDPGPRTVFHNGQPLRLSRLELRHLKLKRLAWTIIRDGVKAGARAGE